MRKREVPIRPNLTREQIEPLVEPWAIGEGAEVRPMGRLTRAYATEGENMHWHVSGKTRGMGTVEVAYTPSTGNLTVLVHDNRQGSWAGKAYPTLATHVRKNSKRSSS